MPAPNAQISFSAGVEALRRQDEQRWAREDAMRNALEILARLDVMSVTPTAQLTRFVRATAREGLGRE